MTLRNRYTYTIFVVIDIIYSKWGGRNIFFATARKSGNILMTYLKAFSSDTRQSMKCRIVTYRLTELYSDASRLLSDSSYLDEYRTKKACKYVKRMLPLFRAVVKFCSTNRTIYEIFSLPLNGALLNFILIK